MTGIYLWAGTAAFMMVSLLQQGVRAEEALTASDLRCEYRVNPAGIGVTAPRLSWILQSGRRGQKQTAYRILVASSPDRLAIAL